MNMIRQRLALVALLLCCLAGASVAQPATNASNATNATSAPRRPQPERWLLIVDTSSAMENRAKAVEGVVGELLASGMNGQMRPGAELGVWTYNKELYAGVAPRQIWNPARSNLVAVRTASFLAQQVYRGKGALEPVLVGLSHVVGDSQRLTIVWLSDGSQKISGTPFDDVINNAFAEHKPALAKTRMPLVTVLRAHEGKYSGQNVSVAPWPIQFPAFPGEADKTNAVAKAVDAVAKPAELAKPIYISAEPKKTSPEAAAPVETTSGSIKLRPPPDSLVAETPPAKGVEPVPPLPIAAAQSTPVVAPVEPAPIVKPAEPAPETKAVEPAAAEPPPAADIHSPPAPPPQESSPKPVAPEPQVALAADTVTARKWPLILGIGFMWVAVVVALVLARRARRAHATSLITRSFEQKPK